MSTGAAWRLTARISPRPTVRTAVTDASGTILNLYPPSGITPTTSADAPTTPWAIYLTDAQRRYRLLCFDLDGKTPEAAAAAASDADKLTRLLRAADLSPVICQSGPKGGRHLWIALAEAAPAELVHRLARLAKPLFTTLDLSPVMNAAAGCVRPPGAPHRDGGQSTIIDGDVAQLTSPTGTIAQLTTLVERLAQLVNERATAEGITAAPAEIAADSGRHSHIPGTKRALSAAAAAALNTDTTGEDASAVLWRVLLGAAAAHWRYRDIAQLATSAPGLEHIRSRNEHGRRVPRTAAESQRLLRYQWDRAVARVTSGPRLVGTDETFDARADDIAHQVRSIQERADAAPGRWARGGGPADRRVLDALCILTLQAVSADVEADTRRLALMVGVGRETARTALWRLAEDGWILRSHEADGPHGARWKIIPHEVIPRDADSARSQAAHRPPSTGTATRNALLLELTARAHAAAHDLFTPRGLGLHAGNLYARCTGTLTLPALAHLTGTSTSRAALLLERLADVGVIHPNGSLWEQRPGETRDTAAVALDVAGQLHARAERYAIERELWAWWRAELAWMNTPPAERTARPAPGQPTLVPDLPQTFHPIHPRRLNGRADYRMARRHLTDPTPPAAVAAKAPVIALTEADRNVIGLLGATLVAVEEFTEDTTTQPRPSMARPRSGRGSPSPRHESTVRFVERPQATA